MTNTKRTFISVEVPKSIKEKIGEFVKLIPGLQPHPAENFHITIKFIGEVSDEQIIEIESIMSQAAKIQHFEIGFKGLKFEESRLRFLVRNPEPVLMLRSIIETSLQKINLNHEDPLRYEPHITLGKIKMLPTQEPSFDYESLIFKVDNIVLLETIRGEKAAQFLPLKEFTLQ